MSIFDQQGLISHNTSAYLPRASESIPDMYCGYGHFCHAHRDVMITATFSLIYKIRMVNAAMLPVIFGFTYFFAYVLLDMSIHIANHIRVLFYIWEFVKLNPEQLNLAVVLIWYGTFFRARQYPKVQKFTKHPSPDYLQLHLIKWYCWSKNGQQSQKDWGIIEKWS